MFYDVRFFTVHIFNGAENTIFISRHYSEFLSSIFILMLLSEFLSISELNDTPYSNIVEDNRKALFGDFKESLLLRYIRTDVLKTT